MTASPAGEVLSVSEAEGFNLRLKVYKNTSKSEKTANKRNNIVVLRDVGSQSPTINNGGMKTSRHTLFSFMFQRLYRQSEAFRKTQKTC